MSPKLTPLRLMASIQAERALFEHGPTTWHKLVGDQGHVRVQARHLLANEQEFRVALAGWYQQLGEAVQAAIRTYGPAWRLAIGMGEHRAELWRIVQEHVRRGALLSAALEWQMHQERASAKAVLGYVQKNVWDFVRELPAQVIAGVRTVVGRVMHAFGVDDVMTPLLDRVAEAQAGGADVGTLFDRRGTDIFAGGVATTASTQAANAGASAAGYALGKEGKVNSKRWMTLHGSGKVDNRVRRSHGNANLQTVPLGGQFTVELMDKSGGVETCDHPGDPVLSLGNLRGCRCLAIYLYI